jgi:coproporphyrinogen III oxidase-like Fe-S oxidoreductase
MLEPGTLFAAKPPPLPDEDLAWSMQVECQALLAAHGFAQYEVSAYASAGHQCRHNLNYWRFGDYLGVGAGAHGKLTQVVASPLAIARSTHLREPRRYLGSAVQGPQWRDVPVTDLPFEFMMNTLRLNDGFAPELFTARTGLPFEVVLPGLEALATEGLVEVHAGQWRATPRGCQYLNEVVGRFLNGANSQTGAGS